MKYPTINKEKLDSVNRRRFDVLKKAIFESIDFDSKENNLDLSHQDKELLSWNLATHLITFI